jgi:hypothetical protein
MARKWSVGVCFVWVVAVSLLAYQALAPVLVKKRVTITMQGQGVVQLMFSNAQPHNEIVYLVKTQWTPKLEAAPQVFVGQTITLPYDTYLQEHCQAVLVRYLSIAVVPIAGFLFFRRWRQCRL